MIIPFLLHSLSMSVFSSVIGPFGGFFASGFKRAFKIKVCHFYYAIGLFTSSDPVDSNFDCYLLTGFRRYHPGSRWHYGPVRLPIPNGHLCQRIYFVVYPHGFASEIVATGELL